MDTWTHMVCNLDTRLGRPTGCWSAGWSVGSPSPTQVDNKTYGCPNSFSFFLPRFFSFKQLNPNMKSKRWGVGKTAVHWRVQQHVSRVTDARSRQQAVTAAIFFFPFPLFHALFPRRSLRTRKHSAGSIERIVTAARLSFSVSSLAAYNRNNKRKTKKKER